MPRSRVYVGRLPNNVRERDLERFFKGYGSIRDVILKNGYGFVEFDDLHDAEDAVEDLNGKDLLGERIIVEHAKLSVREHGNSIRLARHLSLRRERFPAPVHTKYRIVVENLSSTVTWQDLKDFMRKVGDVTFVDAHRFKKNEGIVEFASYGDMKNALIKLDGRELNGRKIRLMEDPLQARDDRRRGSRSRSRIKSRSRSRSRSRIKSRSRSRSSSHRRRSCSSSRRSGSRQEGAEKNGGRDVCNDSPPHAIHATTSLPSTAHDDASPAHAIRRSVSRSRSRSYNRH